MYIYIYIYTCKHVCKCSFEYRLWVRLVAITGYDLLHRPQFHGAMVTWHHGTMIPIVTWYHGTMVHGTMVSLYHGTMVPCTVFGHEQYPTARNKNKSTDQGSIKAQVISTIWDGPQHRFILSNALLWLGTEKNRKCLKIYMLLIFAPISCRSRGYKGPSRRV